MSCDTVSITRAHALAQSGTSRPFNAIIDRIRHRMPADEVSAGLSGRTSSNELRSDAKTTGLPARLTDSERSSIDQFCDQCLQLEPRPHFPDDYLLKRKDVQDEIYHRICAHREQLPPGNVRLQLCMLKKLAARIEASILDEEVNDYEVADTIMERIGQLVSVPQVSAIEMAQLKCLVTYRLSLLGPATKQIHILENRNLLAARGGSGHRTWEGALYLSQFLCAHTNRNLTQGKCILELGAGTGYISILCMKYLGAVNVTASEGNEETLENMSENLALNECAYSRSASTTNSIHPRLLKWGDPILGMYEPQGNDGRQIDLILGADITYDQNANPALVSTLRQLLDLNPAAEAVLAVSERNTTTLSQFRELCQRKELSVKVLEYSDNVHDEDVSGTGQRSTCAPFYNSSAPIRIYRIANGRT